MKWQKGPNSQKHIRISHIPTVLAAEFRELTSTFQYCDVSMAQNWIAKWFIFLQLTHKPAVSGGEVGD